VKSIPSRRTVSNTGSDKSGAEGKTVPRRGSKNPGIKESKRSQAKKDMKARRRSRKDSNVSEDNESEDDEVSALLKVKQPRQATDRRASTRIQSLGETPPAVQR
jgi:hypothetical protein